MGVIFIGSLRASIPKRNPSKQHTLIVCRNVRTGEVKYFLSNCVVGRGRVTLRWLLRVAFGRWAIETCFRTAKEELGMDHFEVRGWRCIHRHWYLTQLSYLFCSRLKFQWNDDPAITLAVEQVRAVVNTWLRSIKLQPPGPTTNDRTRNRKATVPSKTKRYCPQVPHKNSPKALSRTGYPNRQNQVLHQKNNDLTL